MDLNRFTEKSQEAIRQAQTLATQRGNQQVDVEHLMLALLEQEGGLGASILLRADVPIDTLHRSLTDELDRLPKVTGTGATDQIYVTGRLNRLLTEAEDEAKRLKDEYISVEHRAAGGRRGQGRQRPAAAR